MWTSICTGVLQVPSGLKSFQWSFLDMTSKEAQVGIRNDLKLRVSIRCCLLINCVLISFVCSYGTVEHEGETGTRFTLGLRNISVLYAGNYNVSYS